MVGVRNFIVYLYRLNKDLLLGLLLFLLGLLLGPLVYLLRGSTMPERGWRCMRVLLARGMFARFVRVAVEWRLGNFGCSVSQLEGIVTTLENAMTVQQQEAVQGLELESGKELAKLESGKELAKLESGKELAKLESGKELAKLESGKKQPHERSEMVLRDLYTLLARMYLYSGHIDGALLLIVRVRKVLGIDRLPALPELDVKTAHLVRASIAAGKLLDGNSLATLVVKTVVLEPQDNKSKLPPRGRQAARRGDAKVIPFPSCNPR